MPSTKAMRRAYKMSKDAGLSRLDDLPPTRSQLVSERDAAQRAKAERSLPTPAEYPALEKYRASLSGEDLSRLVRAMKDRERRRLQQG